MKFSSACVATWRKFGIWISLACIVTAFVVAVVRLHPTNFFGYTEDDSIYFSSAKGLAEGKGYVLASFPGTPAATKYPIFYPWLLSWVWRWNPSFPANLTDAIAISVVFGAIYIVAAYFFLRRFKGIGEIEALILTAFCALHPVVLFYSANLLSDILFAAMALTAMLLADGAIRAHGRLSEALACGILVGLCMLTRAFAVPVAAGILLAAIINRAWRPLVAFSAAAVPFFATLCWRTIFPHLPISPGTGPAASGLGWTHTWTYYTSYLNVWREGVPTTAIFVAMLKNNALLLLSTPATYFINPSVLTVGTVGRWTILVALGIVILGCVASDASRRGVRPLHVVLPFYFLLILIWNYGVAERSLIPFLPLFAASLWFEAKSVLTLAHRSLLTRPRRAIPEQGVAIVLGAMVGFLFWAAVTNYLGGTRTVVAEISNKRASILKEKRDAYTWISHSSKLTARVVAYEDGSVYLYTGRTASRPFTFTTAEFFDVAVLDHDLVHMADVPRAIGAEYWLASDDDYDFESGDAYREGHKKMDKLAEVLPTVHVSTSGRVRVYSLGCLQKPEILDCSSARATDRN